jgi:DNA-binding beta-propeller fold protein YncE
MRRSNLWRSGLCLAGSALCALGACERISPAKSTPPSPRWAITSNDNKQFLDKGGALQVLPAAQIKPDTASLIDLTVSPPKVVAEFEAPGSVNGPPVSAAITPDDTLALIPAPMKLNPADNTKAIQDNRISVVDLTVTPPKVISVVTLPGGAEQPSGISISRDGKLALVANRNDGSIDVLSIAGKKVTFVSKVAVSDPTTTPPQSKSTASVAISPDGKLAITTNDGDHRMTLLKIDGTTVTKVKDFFAGIKPYGLDIASNGKFAITGNNGYARGDIDTMSLIDLETPPEPRTVDTVAIGLTPEGVKIAPDSTYAVAIMQNGSNKGETFPFHSNKGKLVAVKIDGKTLKKVSEVEIGAWPQGAVFTADSKQILVGSMVEKDIEVIAWDGNSLKDTGTRIKLNGGPAAIRTAEPPPK